MNTVVEISVKKRDISTKYTLDRSISEYKKKRPTHLRPGLSKFELLTCRINYIKRILRTLYLDTDISSEYYTESKKIIKETLNRLFKNHRLNKNHCTISASNAALFNKINQLYILKYEPETSTV